MDKRDALRYLPRVLLPRGSRDLVLMRSIVVKLLPGLALLFGLQALPLFAQQPAADLTDRLVLPQNNYDLRSYWMPRMLAGYNAHSPAQGGSFQQSSWSSSTNTIQRMEAAFYCNDTPFVDQVRFPLATLWRGHVKLIGFESDVTTANFVLGLPGQGALHNLSAFGNAFLATHTPPSDQLAGIHMIFSWRANEVEPGDSSGLRGVEFLVRASRGFLPFFNSRSDSGSAAAR